MAEQLVAQLVAGVRNYAYGVRLRYIPFDLVSAAGTAADTIKIGNLPPKATVSMYHSYARWAGWTSGATFSLGWRAYKDEDRVTVAESAAGLLSAISMTNDGAWAHGMLVVATPDDSNPVVGKKFFNNSDPVAIFATIGTQAPGAGDTLEGMLAFYTA